jgi:ELWxxDGT repeat protein
MKHVLRKLVSAGIVTLLAGRVALAAPEYLKLASVPWSGGYQLEVIGNVSTDQFWLLASTPSSSDPNRAACTLYTSNGTDSGTKKLYELFVGKCGALSKDRIYKDGRWYFGMTKSISAWTGGSLYSPEGEELWVVGPESATEIVINPGSDGSSPGSFYSDGVAVYFAATTKTHGRELWTTSGTQASTALFKDINPGTASSNPGHIVYFNNFRYFAADDGVHGRELWRTSGLPSRVELFKDINTKPGVGSDISALFPFKGLLFISANDGVRSQNLWATTGFPQTVGSTAPNETALFKDLYTAKTLNPQRFFTDSGKLHFLSDTLTADGKLASVLWESDGTAQGTSVKYTFKGSAKYLGRAGPAGLAFTFINDLRQRPEAIILGPTVIELGEAHYAALVNESVYFMPPLYLPSNYGVFRYDPYAVPGRELITSERESGSSSFIFERVVTASATHAVMSGYYGYFSVLDKSCTSGYKKNPGQCGCWVSDVDTDSDRTPDCLDTCPTDARKTAPGICGCGKSDADTDSDGTVDCKDACSADPAKTATGLCGCGVSDADTDGDGTPDCKDQCPSDAKKVAAGACGCGTSDVDSDGDGSADCKDQCPADRSKTNPGICGCGVSDADTDRDGRADCKDECPRDATKVAPGACGCGTSDFDSDRDGSADCKDQCPADGFKTNPGICGCFVSDADTDRDGTVDCKDGCPSDSMKQAAGQCGCGKRDVDNDRDGTPDCNDACSKDPLKVTPGACGCGVADVDADGDGVVDCQDMCPTDSAKGAAGVCGCGISDADSDGDGTADCKDLCPTDALKTVPGVCGCGVSDADSDGDGTADCKDLCPTDALKMAPGVCGCGTSDQDANSDNVPDCSQISELSQLSAAPLIQDGKRAVTVTVPAAALSSLRNVTYNVFYQFQSKVKGTARWSTLALKTSSSRVVSIQKPKSVIGIRVYYQIRVAGLQNGSPQSAQATASLK